jgi:hypothetical protein
MYSTSSSCFCQQKIIIFYKPKKCDIINPNKINVEGTIMKKWAKAFLILIAAAAIIVTAVFFVLAPKDRKYDYQATVEAVSIMENTWQTAVPQTTVYDMIKAHFESALPEGMTEKKAIVIGYDGCRADTFSLLDNSKPSGIRLVYDEGGKAAFSYCGGVNYPEKNTQDTSTAPGWCTMLTGVWADGHGIYKNYVPKTVEPKTLLLSLVEDGTVDSSAFYVSWKGHFTKEKATYINEKDYIEQNKLNSVFLCAENDEGTAQNVLNDINKPDCSDFIFLTLEYTDHSGHATGFSLSNPKYVNGFYDADKTGADFVNAIKSRPTYSTEDWLIIITTDHGGIGRNHGGSSIEERITFIVSNKEIPLNS